MNAFSVMTLVNIAASKKASIRELAFYLTLGGLTGIPITDEEGSVAGFVSEQDVIRAIHEKCPLDLLRAEDLMTREVITVTFDTTFDEILGIFATKHVLILPVVQDGKLVGSVTRGEALRAAERDNLMKFVA